MTIKKQIILLASIIIVIPLFCLAFIFLNNYLKSPDRLLIQGYEEIRKLKSNDITQEEWNELISTIRLLPPNVQTLAILNADSIIYSTIPPYKMNDKIQKGELWDLIDNSSNEYFYQFTTLNINGKRIFLVSRINRLNRNVKRSHSLLFQFELFLFSFVFISILVLIFISKSIFTSITILQEKTEQIANGDLAAKIEKKKNQSSNEITSISENLEKMRLSLLEAQNKKNRFIMGISHDLRTPVSIIKGYTEAITDGIIVDKEEINKSLQLISAKSTQLEEMIDTLINYTKLNTSDIREQMVKNSITNFFIEYMKEAKIYGNLFHRTVTTEQLVNENIEVPFNEQLIHRALENLFSNATRYTKENDSIHLKFYKKETNLIFEMIDTGCGMDEEDLNNIFDLFYRGTNSRLEKGMGIGLSVVKNIITTHGWNIEVESKKDFGSKFRIVIPISEQSE